MWVIENPKFLFMRANGVNHPQKGKLKQKSSSPKRRGYLQNFGFYTTTPMGWVGGRDGVVGT
jgi:hypothetical protein